MTYPRNLLEVRWQRGKRWIISLDSLYEGKRFRDRLMRLAKTLSGQWVLTADFRVVDPHSMMRTHSVPPEGLLN